MFLLDCLVYSRSNVSGLESVNKMSVGSPLHIIWPEQWASPASRPLD